MKKILLLGGTMFVGRTLTEKLRNDARYDVTLFNRGKSNAGLFEDVKQLHGNRETEDIDKVASQAWDVVIDFSGYYPVTFQQLLDKWKGKVGRYIFISTVSVYDFVRNGNAEITELSPVLFCTEEQKISKLPDAYGEKKAEMERLLLAQEGMDKIILRPSFISGRYDWTERFYYWIWRVQKGEPFIYPSQQDYTTSITFGDDLANALYAAIEGHHSVQVYNAISVKHNKMVHFMETAARLLNKPLQMVRWTEEQVEKSGLNAGDFPLFTGGNMCADDHLFKADFKFTPKAYEQEIQDMIDAAEQTGWPEPKPGLRWAKERSLLA